MGGGRRGREKGGEQRIIFSSIKTMKKEKVLFLMLTTYK